MTADEIEALKVEFDAATRALRDAADRRDMARDAYNDARCAALLAGFTGDGGEIRVTRVRREQWMDHGADMRAGPFVVLGVDIHLGEPSFVLAPVTKAGKPHASLRKNSPRVFIFAEDQPEPRHD